MRRLMRYDRRIASCEERITQIETSTLTTHQRGLLHLQARAQARGTQPTGRVGDRFAATVHAEAETILAWQTVEIERANIMICELQIEERRTRMDNLKMRKLAILSELGIGTGGFLF